LQHKSRVNHQIKSPELRVIGADGANYGVITLSEALARAQEAQLDLIEISPDANPPVAKIMDYGKYLYAENKKQKQARSRAHAVEIKQVQVTIGTSDHDLGRKMKEASDWLKEGHRIKLDLFLKGREKYLDPKFLEARLLRALNLTTEPYKIADPIKKGPKGISLIIEKDK
jgi:translation initiation factor IF-3